MLLLHYLQRKTSVFCDNGAVAADSRRTYRHSVEREIPVRHSSGDKQSMHQDMPGSVNEGYIIECKISSVRNGDRELHANATGVPIGARAFSVGVDPDNADAHPAVLR
jgi:hypothetical protein